MNLVFPQKISFLLLNFLSSWTISWNRFLFKFGGTFNLFLSLQEIRQAAEFMDLAELLVFVSNVQSHEEFLNTALKQRFKLVRYLVKIWDIHENNGNM